MQFGLRASQAGRTRVAGGGGGHCTAHMRSLRSLPSMAAGGLATRPRSRNENLTRANTGAVAVAARGGSPCKKSPSSARLGAARARASMCSPARQRPLRIAKNSSGRQFLSRGARKMAGGVNNVSLYLPLV
jgi:hypothetical protein